MKAHRLFIAILKFGPTFELQLAHWEGDAESPAEEICIRLKDEFSDHILQTWGTRPDKITIYDITRDPTILDYIDRTHAHGYKCQN